MLYYTQKKIEQILTLKQDYKTLNIHVGDPINTKHDNFSSIIHLEQKYIETPV